jgi:hypothetical protein
MGTEDKTIFYFIFKAAQRGCYFYGQRQLISLGGPNIQESIFPSITPEPVEAHISNTCLVL